LRTGTVDELGAWWDNGMLTERRRAVKDTFKPIVIHKAPVKHGGSKFNTGRVELTWRPHGAMGRALDQVGAGSLVDEGGNLYPDG
jgi:hypothetical protein